MSTLWLFLYQSRLIAGYANSPAEIEQDKFLYENIRVIYPEEFLIKEFYTETYGLDVVLVGNPKNTKRIQETQRKARLVSRKIVDVYNEYAEEQFITGYPIVIDPKGKIDLGNIYFVNSDLTILLLEDLDYWVRENNLEQLQLCLSIVMSMNTPMIDLDIGREMKIVPRKYIEKLLEKYVAILNDESSFSQFAATRATTTRLTITTWFLAMSGYKSLVIDPEVETTRTSLVFALEPL